MLEGKTRAVSVKSAILISILLLLLGTFPLLSGCAQESTNRSEGQFPNVPALLDQMAASPDEDFSEELNLSEDDNGAKTMPDLNGWSGYSEIDFSASSEKGNPTIKIAADNSEKADANYFIFSSGIVTKGKQVGDEADKYVTNLISNPAKAEKAFCEKLVSTSNFDKESDVAQQILESCGINANGVDQESQRYVKSSPLDLIKALSEGDIASSSGAFGSSYAVVGESKTPDGKPLYFKINVSDRGSASELKADLGDEAYSYIEIPDKAEQLFSAEFRLNEAYTLDEPESFGKQSESPIDSKEVFSYMSNTSEADSDSPTGKTVAYKSTDDPDTVFVLTIENDETWYISFCGVVDGKVPEKLGENVNGQGLISGKFYRNGQIVGSDGMDDPHFQFVANSKGIKVTCTDRITSMAEEVQGFYYYDLSSALAN